MADARRIFANSFLQNRSDLFVAVGTIIVVLMLIIPIPTFLLDAFMAFNLVLSLLVLLITLYTRRATEFSVFPSLLLVSTIFSLALNVSSVRLILTMGSKFDGRMIRAFSRFVVGSGGTEGLVVGFIIFIIIIAVQAIVITKGATRDAEVAARFALDSLPGKQMSIEAEYNSGAITEEEAQRRKRDLQREADFYGAMDGASKFISGNVKVGIFITIVNLIAGMIVGMVIHQEDFNTAITTYTSLTIGDGLLTQFPALLISTATGIVVTRSISDGTFGKDVKEQFSRNARIYWVATGVLLVFAVLPGFPWYVLIPMAALTGFVAYRLSAKDVAEKDKAKLREAAVKKGEGAPAEMAPIVPLDPLSLELGYGLIPLVDKDKATELLDRITGIRRESALDMGLVVPRIRIIDNMRLEPSEYCFKIKGVEVGRGTIRLGHFLCINPGGIKEDIPGEKTRDPAFGLPALWITEEYREAAERAGYTVVDPSSIIATHLTEIIKRHAASILGRQEVQSIIDALKKDYPAVSDEAMKVLSVGEIQKVLQGLLREQVSVRNMVAILETLSDYGGVTKDVGFLVEKVRQALGRQICLQYSDEAKTVKVITIDPVLEQKIIDARVESGGQVVCALEPELQRRWIKAVSQAVRAVQERGMIAIVLCSEAARYLVKFSTDRELPDLAVLSVPEIVSDMSVEAIGEIRLEG
jgi:flagellar biosynthesis protein FlhA